ncbi:unnamed protein product [Echinostoma caproni]|uniref:Cadherin domain-containing protein n=1 Tax=Echinostoma caproni TaxID=27848 RepID=A0A183A7P0_9TREM|nr:unnamed protein product [Echinostoma caproni]
MPHPKNFYKTDRLSQLLERITVIENSPLNTVILDLRSALVRHGEGQLPPNATAYASQQEAFWPFVLEDFVIKLGRPLDREAICQRQKADMRSSDAQTGIRDHLSYGRPSDSCLPEACCQLLHVNILPSPTALPKAFYIEVAVQDINDNAPQFPPIHSPYTMVREDVGLDEKIWLPQAVDLDSPRYSVIDYRTENWVHGNASHFQLGIAEENGLSDTIYLETENLPITLSSSMIQTRMPSVGRPFIKPTGPLDREACDTYAFTLIAVDGGDQMISEKHTENRVQTGTVNVVIKIADINDNRPVFDNTFYEVKVVENIVTSSVLEFEVTDNDTGDNGRIAVNIHDPAGHAQRLFRVGLHPITKSSTHSAPADMFSSKGSYYKGFLQLISHIDAERYPATLRFSLVASDMGQPSLSSRANVQIHIINVNDNAPQIAFFSRGRRLADNRISLPEIDTPPLSLVVLVHVTDADSPVAQIRCRITHESEMFSLEEATGSGYSNVRHEALYEPVIEPRGIVASYRQFALRTKAELDRETKSHYTVTIACTDEEGSQSLSRNASLHVTITDVNDHSPVFDRKVYSGRVAENMASAEVYLSSPMRVTDADLGANALLTFSLLDVQNGTESIDPSRNESLFFRTDSRSGRIWTVIPLDCETRSKYTLMLVVCDSGSPVARSSSALIHVTVEDSNDNAPEFSSAHYLFEIPENSPGGTEIGRVEAVDHDVTEVNRKLHYILRGRPEDLHLISIDRNTGVLRTRRPIDRESRSSISLLVTAENEVPIRLITTPDSSSTNSAAQTTHRLSAEASLVVTILNVNDNRPEFILIEPHRSHITFIWEQLGVVPEPNETAQNRSDIDIARTSESSVSEAKSIEQTLSSDQSRARKLFAQNPSPVCERLPHRVTDKDMTPENNFDCCILELLDDHDGLFALMPEAPNVLCAMRRPPRPKSYKLTLIARDGLTNDSLSSQVCAY